MEYLSRQKSAWTPSFHPIFFPSSSVRPIKLRHDPGLNRS
jgi:hypothetical protein